MTDPCPDDAPLPDAHPRIAFAGLAVALALAVAAFALAVHSDRLASQATPEATVRDFLTAAVVDRNPVTACGYLTPRARKSIEAGGSDCASFFAAAQLRVAGRPVDTDGGLDRLRYAVHADGAARIVDVGRGLAFVLRPASAAALSEFAAPAGDWRIDSSVAAL